MGTEAKCVWPVRARLGEGPVWDARDASIYFVDIKAPALHRFNVQSGVRTSWPMAEPICWIIPRATAPGFIAGFKSGFAELQVDPLTITPIGAPEPERKTNRLNDAKADRTGAIWAGSMDDDEKIVSGALYRIAPDRSWKRMDDGYAIANGPTFSPDGRVLYHTDTGPGVVYRFDVGADGALSNKREFVRFRADWGAPDGMTTDAEGGVWIAHWGGARVTRFTPAGAVDRAIAIPAAQVTSCVFAGPQLDRMFVTTAAVGRENEELAGALFEIDPGVRGAPAYAFNG